MKYETYERAVEIRNRVNYLEDIIMVLQSATSTHCKLAATKCIPAYSTETEIMNEEKLDTDLRDKFIKILRDEQKDLRAEFDAL